jgi:hypothetical protein
MQDSAGVVKPKNARGLRGKDAVKGRRWSVGMSGCRVSWRDIMERPARAKQPAPMLMLEARQRASRRADAEGERETEMWDEFIAGVVEGE